MSYLLRHWDRVLELFIQHLTITALVLGIALAIALPLGVFLHRFRPLRTPVVGLASVLYTIPSMAFFAMLIPVVGLGLEPAVVALVAYSQFILVRNVIVGLDGVDAAVLEAAAGMGLSPWQVFWGIKAPLALPVVLAGVRVATVSTISLSSLAAWINAGGLGVLLFEGLYQNHQAKAAIGTVAVALLAVAANYGLQRVERWVRRWALEE